MFQRRLHGLFTFFTFSILGALPVRSHPLQAVSDPEEQFDTFVGITERYLQPTSPQEVNISSKMQANIASLQDKDAFLGLDEESRRHVLQVPLKEIVRMLEDNLLTKFKQSPEVRKWREEEKRQDLGAYFVCAYVYASWVFRWIDAFV